jgi:hypothetical protein
MEYVLCERRDGSRFTTTAAWAEQNAKTLEFHGTVVVGPAEEPTGDGTMTIVAPLNTTSLTVEPPADPAVSKGKGKGETAEKKGGSEAE